MRETVSGVGLLFVLSPNLSVTKILHHWDDDGNCMGGGGLFVLSPDLFVVKFFVIGMQFLHQVSCSATVNKNFNAFMTVFTVPQRVFRTGFYLLESPGYKTKQVYRSISQESTACISVECSIAAV